MSEMITDHELELLKVLADPQFAETDEERVACVILKKAIEAIPTLTAQLATAVELLREISEGWRTHDNMHWGDLVLGIEKTRTWLQEHDNG